MKQEIKVGDWVKISYWKDFFEVIDVTEDEIILKTGNAQYYSSYYKYKYENWIIKEKDKPVKIEMNKKYRRVGTHEPVRVICVDRKVDDDSLPCVGLWLTKPNVEAMVYFDHSGVDQYGQKSIEEVPQTDWSKVQVDTLIWVGNIPRHFASYDGEWVYYFEGGTTSQTAAEMKAYRVQTDALWCSLEEPR